MIFDSILNQEGSLINLAFLLLLFQTVLRTALVVTAGPPRKLAKGLDGVLIGLLSVSLLIRWYSAHHFPISNLYESLIFLSLLLSIGIFRREQWGSPVAIITLVGFCPLLVVGFASFCLPVELQAAGPLVPALKSNWLLRHVTVRILSYAGLRLGSLLSILFLGAAKILNDSPILEQLDNLSYRLIGFGFPFLTLGILSGAVWANETWGSYWSWDPKETWSLITWLVFAAYLHTRLVRGEKGQLPAKVASGGFILVWICYLGVNLLGKGLHSYGWFS